MLRAKPSPKHFCRPVIARDGHHWRLACNPAVGFDAPQGEAAHGRKHKLPWGFYTMQSGQFLRLGALSAPWGRSPARPMLHRPPQGGSQSTLEGRAQAARRGASLRKGSCPRRYTAGLGGYIKIPFNGWASALHSARPCHGAGFQAFLPLCLPWRKGVAPRKKPFAQTHGLPPAAKYPCRPRTPPGWADVWECTSTRALTRPAATKIAPGAMKLTTFFFFLHHLHLLSVATCVHVSPVPLDASLLPRLAGFLNALPACPLCQHPVFKGCACAPQRAPVPWRRFQAFGPSACRLGKGNPPRGGAVRQRGG